MGAGPQVGMSFAHANARDPTGTEVRARMKVLIGVDPHKASIALAVVDEVGELIECASFPHNRAGLRALERWAKRFPERRWAVENAGGLGNTCPRGWQSGWRVGGGRATQAFSARAGALDRQCSKERWAGRSRHRAGRLGQRAAAYGRSRGRGGSAATAFRKTRGLGRRAYPSVQ